MAKKASAKEIRTATANGADIGKLLSSSIYYKKKRIVELKFKNPALADLVKLFLGAASKSTVFSNKVRFDVNELEPGELLTVLKFVQEFK